MADLNVCDVCGGVDNCRVGCSCAGCIGERRDRPATALRDPRDVAEHIASLFGVTANSWPLTLEAIEDVIKADRAARQPDTSRPCHCGSGAHPRRCETHPRRYKEHCQELSIESLAGDVERLRALLDEVATHIEALREYASAWSVAWARRARKAIGE